MPEKQENPRLGGEPLIGMLRRNPERNLKSVAYGKMGVTGDVRCTSFTAGLISRTWGVRETDAKKQGESSTVIDSC